MILANSLNIPKIALTPNYHYPPEPKPKNRQKKSNNPLSAKTPIKISKI